jgi:hypothetical protein
VARDGSLAVESAASGDGWRPPDAGLAGIAADFRAGVGPVAAAARVGAAAAAPGGHERGGGPRIPRVSPEDMWVLRLPPQSSTAASNFDPVDWGPPPGRVWEIRSAVITLQGASLVSIYWEAALPVNLEFQTTVSGVWDPKELVMINGDRLIAVGTGGGFTIGRIRGKQMSVGIAPDYLL